MSASTAIGKVSESLRNLLDGEMELDPKVKVTILAPDEGGGDRRVNLFLYKVQENQFLRNADWQVKPDNPTRLVRPLLSLNLFYLMTPYATNDPDTGNSTAHAILGEAMRVFYENPVIPEIYLDDDLSQAREQIRIVQNTLDPAELSHIWNTFTQPFRLSVLYQVSVVQLDMSKAGERKMAPRPTKINVRNVEARFRPPIVSGMEPAKGRPGSSVAFFGENLAGWKASVTLSGKTLLDGQVVTGDSFQINVPDPIAPGLYEMKVDISGLFRRTFFFEVSE